MTNSPSTKATFGGAQCSKMIVKKQECHSKDLADKQIKNEIFQSTLPQLTFLRVLLMHKYCIQPVSTIRNLNSLSIAI